MIGFSGDGGEGRPSIKVELPLVRGLEVVRRTVAALASGVNLLWNCLLAGFYHCFLVTIVAYCSWTQLDFLYGDKRD